MNNRIFHLFMLIFNEVEVNMSEQFNSLDNYMQSERSTTLDVSY